MSEFKSFFKNVGGNEGSKCKYPVRLDTYGCGCSHDCKYCVGGDTDVLMYDGSTKKMRDIKKGDQVYGIREEGRYRRFTLGTVEHVWKVSKPSYKITLTNGVELVCSADHQWLTNRGWKFTVGQMTGKDRRPYLSESNNILGFNFDWNNECVETDDYRMGYLTGVIRGDGHIGHYEYDGKRRNSDTQHVFRLALKCETITRRAQVYLEHFGIHTSTFDFPMIDRKTKERYVVKAIGTRVKGSVEKIESLIDMQKTPDFLRGFLAGIYDAEGTSDKYIKRIFNSDDAIIEHAMMALDLLEIPYTMDKPYKAKNVEVKTIRLSGGIASTLKMFGCTNPSKARYACLEGVALKNPSPNALRVKSVERMNESEELYDITTSTGNFIANGVVAHNCYAKSLLDFRKLWHPEDPAQADVEKIRKQVAKIAEGKCGEIRAIRLGGMTDCFQPVEANRHVTFETLKILAEYRVPYLIVTKSDLVATDEYMAVLDKDLAHIQVTVTTTDDDLSLTYEKAVVPSRRIAAIERLQSAGFDVALRLSPFIPEYVDLDRLNKVKCDKIQVEFLRVNSWIQKWFPIDYSDYTVKQSGYRHLPLEKKKELIKGITGFKEVSVCEDESEAYEYWKAHFNPNPDDCCNLRM